MSPDSKDIKFPASHYVGFQTRPAEDGVPLGFMTPDGTDDAAKKRKATVDSWSRGYGYSAKNEGALPAKTLENQPMSGFKLGRSLRHSSGGWGQGNVKWRIEDPRGFELEITSPNLAQIMSCTTIENGEILEQCMWARLKSDNVLVPVSSDVYKAAQANTARLSKSASMKDIKPGDYAVMQNGAEGIYMGHYYIGNDGIGYYGQFEEPSLDKKYHMFLLDGKFRHKGYGDQPEEPAIRMIADPKLSEIQPTDTPMTPTEAEAKMLVHIVEGIEFEGAGNSYCSKPDFVIAVQAKKPKNCVSRQLEPFDLSTITDPEDRTTIIGCTGSTWFSASAGGMAPAASHRWLHHGDFQGMVFDMAAYEADGILQNIKEGAYSGFYRTYSTRSDGNKQIEVERAKVDKGGFVVRVVAVTPLGNAIDFLA